MIAEAHRRIDADLAGARRWFQVDIIGIPMEILDRMPAATDEDLANTRTIVHELAFLPGTPAPRFSHVETPTLVMASDHTAPEILDWAAQLEAAMPSAVRRVLPGQWHGVDDATLTDTIRAHLLGGSW